jgi:hypothetical protein
VSAEACGCRVYIVASAAIDDDWPKGVCPLCRQPLCDHEKRVRTSVPTGFGYIVDEAVIPALDGSSCRVSSPASDGL